MQDAIYEGEWLIALSAAGKFFGKRAVDTNAPDYPRGIRLEPVYEIVMMQTNQNGAPAVIRQLMPILLIPTDIGLTLADDTALISVSTLLEAERDSWFTMLRNVRAGMQQLRSQRTGIAIPTTAMGKR